MEYVSQEMSSLGIYHKMNKKFIPLLEDFIIFRDIEFCASEKGVKMSNKEIIDLKDIIIDFYNEDSKMNYPLSYTTKFIVENYIEGNIRIKELRDSSFYDIYDAIELNNIDLLREKYYKKKELKSKER